LLSPPQQVEYQGQYQADNQHGGDGKEKGKVFPAYQYIPGKAKTSQTQTRQSQNNKSCQQQDYTESNQNSSYPFHLHKLHHSDFGLCITLAFQGTNQPGKIV